MAAEDEAQHADPRDPQGGELDPTSGSNSQKIWQRQAITISSSRILICMWSTIGLVFASFSSFNWKDEIQITHSFCSSFLWAIKQE